MKQITLANLSEATEQEVYDQVATHLLTQNCKPKERDYGLCLYRGPNNTKCAAGCLIADSEYRREMEGVSWRDLARDKRVPLEHSNLIMALQRVHDRSESNEWPIKLKQLALEWGLKPI